MPEHLAGTSGPPLFDICRGGFRPPLGETDRQERRLTGKSVELETNLTAEVEFKLRGMLSSPPRFICDAVYFNRFLNDLMRAARNPFDPPIINTKISIRERTGRFGSHVEGAELRGASERRKN